MMIAAGKFKAQCLKIMDDLSKHRREIIITKYGKPVARLTGIGAHKKEPLFGLIKGSVVIKGDIISPVGDVWDAQQA